VTSSPLLFSRPALRALGFPLCLAPTGFPPACDSSPLGGALAPLCGASGGAVPFGQARQGVRFRPPAGSQALWRLLLLWVGEMVVQGSRQSAEGTLAQPFHLHMCFMSTAYPLSKNYTKLYSFCVITTLSKK
jgi:hypothetical protein